MKRGDAGVLAFVLLAVAGIGVALALAMGTLEDVTTDIGPPPPQDLITRAEDGNAEACFSLGQRYRQGRGVAADARMAMTWFECAARSGHASARYEMGRLHEAGEGVRQDFERAAELYRLAADLGGHAGAQYALGQLHYSGRGVPNDYGLAIRWYRLAAEGNYAPAQHVLGTIYEHGWGVDADPIAAYVWYTLAMRQVGEVQDADPNFDPRASRARLAAKMNRFETERAERRARDWRPNG